MKKRYERIILIISWNYDEQEPDDEKVYIPELEDLVDKMTAQLPPELKLENASIVSVEPVVRYVVSKETDS